VEDGRPLSGGVVLWRGMDIIMKRALSLLLAFGLLSYALVFPVYASGGVVEVADTLYEVVDWPIVVNGERIDAPQALRTSDGCRLVPLRAIAEAIGYEVKWHDDTFAVTLNDSISLSIGQNRYIIGERVISVDCYALRVPIIRDGRTFVPFCFFRDILEMTGSNTHNETIRVVGGVFEVS